jgi:hypothetical protein
MVSIPANLSVEKIITIVAGIVQFNKQDLDTMKTVNLNIKMYTIVKINMLILPNIHPCHLLVLIKRIRYLQRILLALFLFRLI